MDAQQAVEQQIAAAVAKAMAKPRTEATVYSEADRDAINAEARKMYAKGNTLSALALLGETGAFGD